MFNVPFFYIMQFSPHIFSNIIEHFCLPFYLNNTEPLHLHLDRLRFRLPHRYYLTLQTVTHYLNLDAVGARYACPKAMLSTNTKTEPKPQENASTAATAPKPSTPATPAPAFKVGDTVQPLRLVDYDGRRLRQYDDNYTILQIHGNRAVLTARGQVWAAMRKPSPIRTTMDSLYPRRFR